MSLDLIITIATIAAFGLAVVAAVGTMSRNLRNELREDIRELRGDMRSLDQKMERRFDAVDRKFEAVDARFDAIDRKFEAVDAKIEDLRKDLGSHQRAQDQRIDTAMALAV